MKKSEESTTADLNQNNLESTTTKIRPCCACPLTKRLRDDCFLRYGPPSESNESMIKCADLISAHRDCMKKYGFNI